MIYAIAVNGAILASSFHSSWDACWDTIWEYRMQETNVDCELIALRETAAPATSLRPKEKPE